MLVQFSLRNYKVFRETATLSLIASNYDRDTLPQNVVEVSKFNLRLLETAVIYGANASGKSKLIEGLSFMARFVRDSSKETQSGEPIPVEPFRLSTETEAEPTEMEIIFIHEDVLYRYGFELSQERVVAEWLYQRPNTKEVELFHRDDSGTTTHPKLFGGIINQLIKEDGLRPNALLLSVAAQFNNKIANRVVTWFNGELHVLSGLREGSFSGFTAKQTDNPEQKQKILRLLQEADLSINDIIISKLDVEKLPDDMPNELKDMIRKVAREKKAEFFDDVMTKHQKYDADLMPVGSETFSMERDESSGTRKFFAFTGPILDVLENGHTLFVDELDAKLHPNLVCKLVDIFNAPETNPHNAQLIFNTHDTNLLSSGNFRRDQIWFTEKDRYGAATLYSLGEFKVAEDGKAVRKNDNYEQNYIRGRYGAIPYLGDFARLFDQSTEQTHAEER
jgi:uncharacterized protein